MSTDAANAERTIYAYFECLDTEDWERMRTLWTDDCEVRAVGARKRHGVEEALGLFKNMFVPWAAHRDQPTRVVLADATAMVEVTFSGTTRDGREVSFEAVDVFDLRNDKIHRLSNWYDIAYARKVLTPASTSKA